MKARFIKSLTWLSGGTVGLILLISALLGGFVLTNAGLKLVVWSAQQAVPQLRVGQVNGALYPGFELTEVAFADPDLGVDLEVQRFAQAVSLRCLLYPALCIKQLEVSGVRLNLALPESDSEMPQSETTASVGYLYLPLAVDIRQIALNDIDIRVGEQQVYWRSLTSSLYLKGEQLTLGNTLWQGLNLHLPVAADEPLPPPQPFKLSLQEQLAQVFPLALPEIFIPLRIEVAQFQLQQAKIQQAQTIEIERFNFGLKAGGYDIHRAQFALVTPEASVDLSLKARLTKDYPLELKAQLVSHLAELANQRLDLTLQGSLADLNLDARLSQGIQANLQAKAQLLTADVPFQFKLTQGDLAYPLQGAEQYRITLPLLSVEGDLSAYQLELNSQFTGAEVPKTALTLAAKGDLNQIQLNQLALETLSGVISGKAQVAWFDPVARQANVRWESELAIEHLDITQQFSQWQAMLDGQFATQGELDEQGDLKLSVPTLNLQGVVQGYPLTLQGELKAQSQQGEWQVQTQGIDFAHGNNRLHAKGQLDEHWLVDLQVDFPEIASTLPELSGQLTGDIQIQGERWQPVIQSQWQVERLKWQPSSTEESATVAKAEIDQLKLNLQGQWSDQPQAQLELAVHKAHFQDQELNELVFTLQGSPEQHQLKLSLDSERVTTDLALAGAWLAEPKQWQASLEQAQIGSLQGQWQLVAPAAFTLNMAEPETAQLELAAHCWQQADSLLCVDEPALLAQSGQLAVSLRDFSFEQIAHLLPKNTQLQGLANMKLNAHWQPEQLPQAQLQLELGAGQLIQQLDAPLVFAWNELQTQVQLADDQASGKLKLAVQENGDLLAQFQIEQLSSEEPKLNAQLQLTPFNLNFLDQSLGQYNQVNALLESQLQLTGSLYYPQVHGQLNISQIHVDGELSPVSVDDGKMNLVFAGYQARLDSQLETRQGEIVLSGDANWQQLEDWQAELSLTSSRVNIALPPMVKLDVAPNLHLQAAPQWAKVSGSVNIPWGRIVVEELPPSAVQVSKDQLLLDEDLQPLPVESLPLKLELDVQVKLGEDVRLSAFGLTSHLAGQLAITQKEHNPWVVGEINLQQGKYRSFGQDLQIQEGNIRMNGLVDQPFVSIKAIRNPENTQDDVIAGVQVTGSADEPNVTIFSEPAMPQANALSYLLRGQNIGSDGQGGDMMTTALIGLSLAQSGKVVGQIGESLGVQDLQLDTQGSGDNSQVTVSGYIAPGLQVKYGVGIFNSVGEFTVRYRLMRDLYLEAVSGLESAVDILYSFEFD